MLSVMSKWILDENGYNMKFTDKGKLIAVVDKEGYYYKLDNTGGFKKIMNVHGLPIIEKNEYLDVTQLVHL